MDCPDFGVGDGICECGCGEPTLVAPVSNSKYGWVRGKPRRFLAGHNLKGLTSEERARGVAKRVRTGVLARERNPGWRGGRHITRAGYVMILVPEHHLANSKGYALEHRVVMERVLGRELLRSEDVHHINGDKADNRPENLEVVSRREHMHRHYTAETWPRPPLSPCGTSGSYRRGCRCQTCMDAKNDRQRAYRARKRAGL